MSEIAAPKTECIDRREEMREALVLRIGVISTDERNSFCLIKNVSSGGMLVKLFGHTQVGSCVSLRVGDEPPIKGRVAWARDQFAGIEFANDLQTEALLRVKQKLAPTKRRSSPRVRTAAKVIVRTAGNCCAATLQDISAVGARVMLHNPISVAPSATITLAGLPSLRAFVQWHEGTELGLSFETPLPIALIANWVDERVPVRP